MLVYQDLHVKSGDKHILLRDCPWAYAHPEKCVERLAPTWIREARARHDSLRVPPGMRRSREPDYAML